MVVLKIKKEMINEIEEMDVVIPFDSKIAELNKKIAMDLVNDEVTLKDVTTSYFIGVKQLSDNNDYCLALLPSHPEYAHAITDVMVIDEYVPGLVAELVMAGFGEIEEFNV